jgi:hypothetical protein
MFWSADCHAERDRKAPFGHHDRQSRSSQFDGREQDVGQPLFIVICTEDTCAEAIAEGGFMTAAVIALPSNVRKLLILLVAHTGFEPVLPP